MEYKVRQFINNEEFQKDTYPHIKCYLEAYNLNKGYFNKKEQTELFDYFLAQRKELILPYLYSIIYNPIKKSFEKYLLIEFPIFSNIRKEIKEKLEKEIELIFNKRRITEQDIFDLFDYIVSIYTELGVDKTIDYIKKSFEKIEILNKSKKNIDKKKIIQLIKVINIIEFIKVGDIINHINFIISILSDKLDKKDICYTIYYLLMREDIIKIDYKDLVYLFIENELSNSEGYDYIYYNGILTIIEKIQDEDFLKSIFYDFFPDNSKIYTIAKYFALQFIIIDRVNNLKINIDRFLDTDDRKYLFIKHIGYLYNNYLDENLTINLNHDIKLECKYLLNILKKYICKVSKTNEFTYEKNYLWASKIFREYINTEEIYNSCSEEAQKFRLKLIINENDPLYTIAPKEIKKELKELKNIEEKRIKIKTLNEEEKINCIKYFFNKEKILKDLKKIKEYFNDNSKIKSIDFYKGISNINRFSYEYRDNFVNSDIVILNPFLISYIMDYLSIFKNEVDLDKIYSEIDNNWNKCYVFHLYNYLIYIKKYDYNFSNNEKKKIKSYFKSLKIYYPKFILWNVNKVFGFDLKLNYLIDDNIVLELLKTNYMFLINDNPKKVFIFNGVRELYESGIINTNLEFESKDFSLFFKRYNINNIENIFNICLEKIDISKSIYLIQYDYYFFLSIINIYNILPNKEKYTNKIKELIILYFKNTLDNAGKVGHISQLVIKTTEKLNILEDILKILSESSQIEYEHFNQISIWQDTIIKNEYNETILNIIFDIRNNIKKDKIKVIKYINTDTDRVNNFKNELLKLRNKINITSNIDDKYIDEFLNYILELNEKFKIDNYTYSDANIKENNIIELLIFINKDISIFEDFCLKKWNGYHYHRKAIENLLYVFNNIIIDNEKATVLTYTISKIYPNLPSKINYPVNTLYTPQFELRIIIDEIINMFINIEKIYDEKVYDNLININNLDSDIKKRLQYKRNKLFAPIKIIKKNNKYLIIDKYDNKKDYNKKYNKKELKEKIFSKINKKDGIISRIVEFSHLIEDIKNKQITMSHPYLFEDEFENQYPIDKNLYISCFSYTVGKENAYAWWKLYGNKTKFRLTVKIEYFIDSIISILDKNSNEDIELYIGSLDYKDDISNNENEWDFFDKRKDFNFETELRIMVKVNTPSDEKIKYVNGLPVLYKLNIGNMSIYKNMSVNHNDIIFHPYDKTLLCKDKEAMLKIIKKNLNKK